MTPLVSIMVPVMGAAEHLEETLLSLLNQTLQDFEIIVVNGGLEKSAQKMLDRYSSVDERIKVFPQHEPGISAARTQAMTLANGKYCAVNDSDDISLPHRLERQIEYLETNPEISLCGAWIETLGAGPSQIRKIPTDDATIRSIMMFLCPFAQSTVVWRREEINQTGQEYLLHSSEDYDLWARLLPFIKFANLPEVLVRYRLHEGQRSHVVEVTDRNWQYQLDIRASIIRLLGIEPSDEEMQLHQTLCSGLANKVWIDEAEAWLTKLRNANYSSNYFPLQQFDQVIAERWWVFSLRTKSNPDRVLRFINSSLNSEIYLGVLDKIIAILRYTKNLIGLRVRSIF